MPNCPNCFLHGERACLRALELDDADRFWAWFSDREATRYSLTQWVQPISKLETQEWLEKEIRSKSNVTFGIKAKDTQHLIGFAGISGINCINSSGEYFIFIGDKDYWNRGVGTEVTRMVADYGFKSLNLNRLMLTVSDINDAGKRAYEKTGFRQEGVLREACYREGRYHDKVIMSVLRSEWGSVCDL